MTRTCVGLLLMAVECLGADPAHDDAAGGGNRDQGGDSRAGDGPQDWPTRSNFSVLSRIRGVGDNLSHRHLLMLERRSDKGNPATRSPL